MYVGVGKIQDLYETFFGSLFLFFKQNQANSTLLFVACSHLENHIPLCALLCSMFRYIGPC